jgi:hypothetical protein
MICASSTNNILYHYNAIFHKAQEENRLFWRNFHQNSQIPGNFQPLFGAKPGIHNIFTIFPYFSLAFLLGLGYDYLALKVKEC